MPGKMPWFERGFDFTFPVELYPNIVERLRGTPARIEEMIRSYPSAILTQRDGDTWSIQENVGHLLDLEPLWAGRVGDIQEQKQILRPADLTNRATKEADHNSKSIDDLLRFFREARLQLIERLAGLDTAGFARCALHPRLQQPMRTVDLCLFVAEHDDYHLARVTELAQQFGHA